ncbi:methyltransferase domain-containing protein [Sorangium sp. So ce429]
MTDSGSYMPRSDPAGWEGEARRLEVQAQLGWAEEASMLRRLGLRDGMSVVELGSGPGYYTARLLEALPTSRITAVEVDPELCRLARERHAAVAPRRLQLVEASAAETGLPGGAADFVVARYLFQHLRAPEATVAEALRLLRPAGRFAIIDVDAALWGVAHPWIPSLETVHRKAAGVQVRRGGDRLVGRRLWRMLRDGGFAAPRLETFVYHSDEHGLDAFDVHLAPSRLLPALAAGDITPSEFTAAVAGYQEFKAASDAFVMLLSVIAHGVRPPCR